MSDEDPHPSLHGLSGDALKHLGTGVAIVEPGNWRLRFENAKFFQWFPPGVEAMEFLTVRIPSLDAEKARARLEKGRVFTFEDSVKEGSRTISLSIQLREESIAGERLVLVECTNISKRKEAEYMLDSYSRMAEKNSRELQKEKDRVERLLLNIMPRSVYEEIKNYGTSTPQRFDDATILLLDFVGFTEMAISGDPGAVVAELNDIFSAFDRIVELFECERIKTIGDAYLAVSGLPEPTTDHAENVARVASRMIRYVNRRNSSHPIQWQARIGIATGPVVGSIVGIHKYVYDIFGPGVNLAARLEALCDPMQILMNEKAAEALRDRFVVSEIEEIEVKGFGKQRIFSLGREIEG